MPNARCELLLEAVSSTPLLSAVPTLWDPFPPLLKPPSKGTRP
jgi:hypothetical protein